MKIRYIYPTLFTILMIFFLPFFSYAFGNESPKAILHGRVPEGLNGTTITLEIFDKHSAVQKTFSKFFKKSIHTTIVKDGKFAFEVPLHEKVHYFNLFSQVKQSVWKPSYSFLNDKMRDDSHLQEQPVIQIMNGFLEPGDDIELIYGFGRLSFSGKGADKIEMLHFLNTSANVPKPITILIGEVTGAKAAIKKRNEIKDFALKILSEYKDRLSVVSYQLLYTDIVSKSIYQIYNAAGTFGFIDDVQRNNNLEFYKTNLLQNEIINIPGIPDDILGLSMYYGEAILKQIQTNDSYHYWRNPPDLVTKKEKPNQFFHSFSQDYNGMLRDKLMLLYILRNMHSLTQDAFEFCVKKAINKFENKCFRHIVLNMNEDFIKGTTAVNFIMKNRKGETVSLSDFKGKVVFVDMWFTGCGACQKVAKAMPEVTKAFKDRNDIVFVSISVDTDKDKWLKSIDKNAEKSSEFRFAGDYYAGDEAVYLYTGGQGPDEAFVEKYVLTGYPTLLIIDKEGKIFSFRPNRPAEGRTHLLIDELKKALNVKRSS